MSLRYVVGLVRWRIVLTSVKGRPLHGEVIDTLGTYQILAYKKDGCSGLCHMRSCRHTEQVSTYVSARYLILQGK